ncbi:MAG TPA: type IV pilus secretin PilQ [Kiritimatiellia bacterium]|nr:type IV pilus secretin PilQ [Kiritimatiellia bacterium]
MKTRACRSCIWLPGIVGIALAIGIGCAAPAVVDKLPALSEFNGDPADAVADPARARALPAAVEDVPRKGAEAARETAFRELPTLILSDLELTDEADVATILRTLAKAAGVNMLVSPQVSGKVAFAFKDVPWDQAFRSVVSTAGLTYMWEGDVLRVMTIDDMKRDLEMETVLKQREGVKAEKRRVEPMAIQVIPIKYAKARNVGATVKTLLAAAADKAAGTEYSSRASVSIDEESNSIIVHAIREDIAKTVALVERLDRAKRQVHIEARIVEATRDAARQLGVQWGGHVARVDDGRLVAGGGQGAGGYGAVFPAQFAQTLDPVGLTLGMVTEQIGASEWLSMQLTALARKGRIQILSSPSIITLDNEAAIVESGEERAYQKSSLTGAGVDLEWKKAVLKLEVVPHVVDEEFLRVEISANKDTFDETKPESNGEFPVNTKHAQTTVLLRNGETVVIGGLSKEMSSSSSAGIPYLMDIPFVGALFRNRGQSKSFDETLIFITPRIIAGR